MPSRRTVAARVQELMKIAQETKGWGARTGTKRLYITSPDGARFDTHLEPTEHFLKEFETNLARRGLPMELPKGQAHPDGDAKVPVRNAAMAKRFDSMNEVERAQAVWLTAVNYAKKHEVEVVTIDGVDFYKITDKPLNYFISMEFGALPYQGEKQCSKPIYAFLRSMTNAVHVSNRTEQEIADRASNGYWLIRVDWNAALTVVFKSPRRTDSIDKRAARLTPREAGEDREPGPVTITHTTPTTATPETEMPKAKPQEKPAEERTTPYTQFKTDQGFQCPECKAQGTERFIKNAQGLAAHRTWAHGVHPSGAQARGGEDGSPLTEVNLAMELLRSEIDKVLSGAGEDEQARQEAASARKEAEQARADVEHQRKRAEAAEGTLKAIREALETLPMTQAFAKIAEVTPHFEG